MFHDDNAMGLWANLADIAYRLTVGRFRTEIMHSWEWESIKDHGMEIESYDDTYMTVFLGTVFQIMPSGKYYTIWAMSNASLADHVLDSAYHEALETIAESFGGWIESGEGDPCDLFFSWNPESS